MILTGCTLVTIARQLARINEELDAASGPRLPSDEAFAFERQHHLVNGGRADAKILLHVGFGRWPAMQARVEVDKRQILPLLGREGFCSKTHTGRPIQLFVHASDEEAGMNVRYRVELSQTERTELTALLSGGKHAARKLKRAQVLLAADAGASDDAIATSVGVSGSTIYRTKRRFVLGNLEAALSEEPRPGADRKLSGKEEALLVATACSNPPVGRARWTLERLAGELVRLTEHDTISRETVRRRLAENELKPWRKDMWCIPQVDGEFVARMEDVLDLYAEKSDPKPRSSALTKARPNSWAK
ncbi:transposase [Bradyrhizobium sp. USDA 4504]